MGRFELLIGEARDGSPVYQQAHSERCRRKNTLCCIGGKPKDISPILCIRSKDEWLVGKVGFYTSLKASVGADPLLPPTTGWLFNTGESFEEDPSTNCTLPSSSPPCCLTVTLSGAAKEAHGDCAGEYRSIGLISAGKQVMSTISRIFLF